MTIRDALVEAYGTLGAAGVDTPVLDATVLLAEATGLSKERLLAELPEELSPRSGEVFRSYLALRLGGLPVSYIRRRKEFYGLEFAVDERVLVPRPETETLVEAVVESLRARSGPIRLHDACTGSGCVAIACARALPELEASASDLSPEALAVCRSNAARLLGRELETVRSDLLESVSGRFDAISANPPYLTTDEALRMRADGWPEPSLALDGGPDGMALTRRLIGQAAVRLRDGGGLFVEIAPAQADELCTELRRAGFGAVRAIPDLSGRPRVLTGVLGGAP